MGVFPFFGWFAEGRFHHVFEGSGVVKSQNPASLSRFFFALYNILEIHFFGGDGFFSFFSFSGRCFYVYDVFGAKRSSKHVFYFPTLFLNPLLSNGPNTNPYLPILMSVVVFHSIDPVFRGGGTHYDI